MAKRRAKGSGRVLRAGKTWGIRYTEDSIRKYQGGYESRGKAEEALDVITGLVKAGLPGAKPKKAGPAPTFDELVDDWFTHREEHDELRSVPDDRVRWKKHLEPKLSHRSIDAVDDKILGELVVAMKKDLEPATIERVLHLLSAFFKYAVARKYTTTNPVKSYLGGLSSKARAKLRSDHAPDATAHLQSVGDVVRVFQALPEPINVAFALSALAGLRPGEVLALSWEDVDLAGSVLHVRRQVRHGHVSMPKSGKGRDVDMVPSLAKVLVAWRKKHPDELLVVPPMLQVKKDGTLVARRNRHGEAKFLNLRTVYAALDAALAACKLPRMTFYEAGRHTFASLWVLRGLDIYKLSSLLGHSSVVVTSRYAHLAKKTPADVLERADIPLSTRTAA